ncbi:GNAT family acetyltransferase [Pseudomonas luteola]|uniref:GNAT family acetyltransferase n=3 Tax=Pseudomonas TaxID=286 RepID=A0A2X2CCM7_PSELU|nr:Acetyltransferase (GNAT) family protein [Pseudomonas lutea]SPZ04883.1 GNAT family acetyltransferase [Pseudomonas luteola]
MSQVQSRFHSCKRQASDVIFRNAVVDDALCIGLLGMQVFLDTYATERIRDAIAQEALDSFSPQIIKELIIKPGNLFAIAEINGHLIGFAHVTTKTSHTLIPDPNAAELKRLYIQERFTGYGIGWKLLQFAEEQARLHKAQQLWASVWVANQRALGFYPKQGYSYIGSPTCTFQDETHENRLFSKALI